MRNFSITKALLSLAASMTLSTSVSLAQAKLPDTVKPADRKLLQEQSMNLYRVIDPLSAKFSPSVVNIKSGTKIIAMGTVTEQGIITKLSEITKKGIQPRIVDHLGNIYPAILKSTNEDYDLALLKNPTSLPKLKFSDTPELKLGSILIAPGAAKQALSMGVLSVISRSLKESDRGFLGVVMDIENNDLPGVLLTRVEDRSAASRAGLQAGDAIVKINNKDISNMIEMRNILQQKKPGDMITMSYVRDQKVISGVKVILGARKEEPRVRRSRMNFMKRMGGNVNQVGEGFPEILQSDMQLKSNHCGAPIIDLDGNFIGIVNARSSRIKTYIVETSILKTLFK